MLALRQLLDRLATENRGFDDFAVEHSFARIGRRQLVLNARRVERADSSVGALILLAIQDTTQPAAR